MGEEEHSRVLGELNTDLPEEEKVGTVEDDNSDLDHHDDDDHGDPLLQVVLASPVAGIHSCLTSRKREEER